MTRIECKKPVSEVLQRKTVGACFTAENSLYALFWFRPLKFSTGIEGCCVHRVYVCIRNNAYPKYIHIGIPSRYPLLFGNSAGHA